MCAAASTFDSLKTEIIPLFISLFRLLSAWTCLLLAKNNF